MKLIKFLSLAAVAVSVAACSSNKTSDQADATAADSTQTAAAESATFVGVIPAADAPGVEYTLVLTPEGELLATGTYQMTTKSLGENAETFTYDGDYVTYTGTPTNAELKYLKLTPSHPDRAADMASSSEDTVYFLVVNDSTLTMTNATLETAPSGLDYNLTRK